MRIALLKAPVGGIIGLEMISLTEPLGLECLAAAAEQGGHTCRIFDLRIDGEKKALEKCREFEPELIGIQSNFTTERYRTTGLARKLRKMFPSSFILVGGHDATRVPEWFSDPSINAVAAGDGEEIILSLMETLQNGADIERVPGLVINAPEGQKTTPSVERHTPVDNLPLPARHLIEEYAPHYYFDFHKPMALMETARGCPYKCNFCSVWKFHKGRFREKSPARVVEELKTIEAPYIFITDDIFWLNRKRSEEIAELMREEGIRKSFRVQSRTDIVCRHPDLVELWRDSTDGLSVFLGVEAVSDEGLASINKRNKAVKNREAIEILKDLGVGFTSNFIVDPQWDRKDFADLRDWIEKTGAYNSGFSVLTPLPGTDLWENVEDDIITDDWEMFDIVHTVLPTKLSLEEFYKEYASLWAKAREVRFKCKGRIRTYLTLVLALITGRVSPSALKRGLNISGIFSDPETFLKAHKE